MVSDAEDSILAGTASLFEPLMEPLGLGDWRIIVSLFSGFMAKESVVSTMEILFGDDIKMYMSSLAAGSMLVFSLLYTPCVAAIASVKRELGKKWALVVVMWQCVIAWVAAFAVRLIGILIGVG